ncbi:MAG: DUF1844 domain-containing protein ['Candidatus Kapabacteria' thiocyanatum]|uniref:DUF1844 domain-containing protein n=1 Tax=Candidatus Kapaibacterium thiocyanatum TaxID=1895771 RepID=A0A1M3L1L6_9BACT|nr:DUF1844 domain-containing protein ['Candidatus Kapabacteria' thiocyanatum]OJX58743.1 MAG: hypothetical protein BGO89_05405 ['Candidatus Kapabacteria' thiocyanatum]
MQPSFLTVVQMFQLEGMVALGKMLNPATNQITKNLDHAKYVIDILDILAEKTSGNLTDDEKKFLDHTVSTLKLNFLEESKSNVLPSPSGTA